MREGTRPSAKAFEEQTKRLAHVEASLQVHEMEIESGKKSVRELSNRVSENNRNHLELVGEIEAKVDGFAETVEAIVFAKEAHERHQAKEELPDAIPGRGGIHQRRVRESTGTNAPDTAFTSSDLRGEPMGFQQALDVGVQVHTDDIRVPKERYVTVSTPKREKKTSEGYGDDGDESHSSSDEVDREKDKKKKKSLTRDYRDTVKKMPLLASPRELMATFVQTPGLHHKFSKSYSLNYYANFGSYRKHNNWNCCEP